MEMSLNIIANLDIIHKELKKIKLLDVYFIDDTIHLVYPHSDFNINDYIKKLFDNYEFSGIDRCYIGINTYNFKFIYIPRCKNFSYLDLETIDCSKLNIDNITSIIIHSGSIFYNPNKSIMNKYIKYPKLQNITNLKIKIMKDNIFDHRELNHWIEITNDLDYNNFINYPELYIYRLCYKFSMLTSSIKLPIDAILENKFCTINCYEKHITFDNNKVCEKHFYHYNKCNGCGYGGYDDNNKKYFYIFEKTLYIIYNTKHNILIDNLNEVYIFDIINFKILSNYKEYSKNIKNIIIYFQEDLYINHNCYCEQCIRFGYPNNFGFLQERIYNVQDILSLINVCIGKNFNIDIKINNT